MSEDVNHSDKAEIRINTELKKVPVLQWIVLGIITVTKSRDEKRLNFVLALTTAPSSVVRTAIISWRRAEQRQRPLWQAVAHYNRSITLRKILSSLDTDYLRKVLSIERCKLQ